MRQRVVEVADQRAVTSQLRWLSLRMPELARELRPGQYLMVRCSELGGAEPPLRRAVFIAAVEPALGQVAALYAPEHDLGLRWLARAQAGDPLDVIGPLGHPFRLDPRTRSLLLVGEGPGLPTLLLLAREVIGRGGTVTMLAAAADVELLPPAFLLPHELEYQSIVGSPLELLDQDAGRAMIAWADQIGAALPLDLAGPLRDRIRRTRMRVERGFTSVLVGSAFACGVGICGTCAIDLRRGRRLACSDGPVFDLRDLAGDGT